MNAANWTPAGLQLFECPDHGVDLTLTPNFLYKSVYCSFRMAFSVLRVLWNWSLNSMNFQLMVMKRR